MKNFSCWDDHEKSAKPWVSFWNNEPTEQKVDLNLNLVLTFILYCLPEVLPGSLFSAFSLVLSYLHHGICMFSTCGIFLALSFEAWCLKIFFLPIQWMEFFSLMQFKTRLPAIPLYIKDRLSGSADCHCHCMQTVWSDQQSVWSALHGLHGLQTVWTFTQKSQLLDNTVASSFSSEIQVPRD